MHHTWICIQEKSANQSIESLQKVIAFMIERINHGWFDMVGVDLYLGLSRFISNYSHIYKNCDSRSGTGGVVGCKQARAPAVKGRAGNRKLASAPSCPKTRNRAAARVLAAGCDLPHAYEDASACRTTRSASTVSCHC